MKKERFGERLSVAIFCLMGVLAIGSCLVVVKTIISLPMDFIFVNRSSYFGGPPQTS